MTNFIINTLEASGLINHSERSAYAFALKFIFEYIIFIAITIAIGALFGLLIPIALFLTVFLCLRMYGGGCHATSHTRCTIYTYYTVIIVCILIHLLSDNWNSLSYYCVNYTYIITCMLYMLITPVLPSTRNNSLKNRQFYRHRSLIICAFFCILYLILLHFNQTVLYIAICAGYLVTTISLLIGRKENIHENKYCNM